MKTCLVNEVKLAEWIGNSTGEILYLSPAITENLAEMILLAEKRTKKRNKVVIQLDHEMDRCGYGETAGVRVLHNGGANIMHGVGIRIAAFYAPGIGVVWTPIAERVDTISSVSVNGLQMEESELPEFRSLMLRFMNNSASEQKVPQRSFYGRHRSVVEQKSGSIEFESETTDDQESSTIANHIATSKLSPTPDIQDSVLAEPKVKLNKVLDEKIKEAEANLQDHPPRDFKQEKQTEVYQSYVGFIEIHVIGASLSKATTLAIPNYLTEVGLDQKLRNKLSEKMRIDLSYSVDLGVREVNKRVDAFREIFTRQMGPPLGRIYKKSDWPIMQSKWAEIDNLVQSANEKIDKSIRSAVEKVISDAAKDWANAIRENVNTANEQEYSEECIKKIFLDQWKKKERATEVELKLFVKDLTWETLNDDQVRDKIEAAYPEICKTGLYTSRSAFAPSTETTNDQK